MKWQIVLVWQQRDMFRARDYFFVQPIPIFACMWLNQGDTYDIEQACNYAGSCTDKKMVYVYPQSEHDPLGRAKRDYANWLAKQAVRKALTAVNEAFQAMPSRLVEVG